MLQAWVDGRLVAADHARISVFDRGFRTGEGVFETCRVYGDHIFRLDAHLARAHAGVAELGFTVDEPATILEACVRTARANAAALDNRDHVLRLTITPGRLDADSPFPGRTVAGPTLVVTGQQLADPGDLYQRGTTAVTVPWGRELPHLKTVSYLAAMQARRHAAARGAEHALLTDPTAGVVLEAATANLFVVRDGVLLTPALDAGLLPGVTRAVVLELAGRQGLAVREQPLPITQLASADEAFLTATTREIVPLVRVDDRPIRDGAPGPVTRQLHAAFREQVAAEVAAASG